MDTITPKPETFVDPYADLDIRDKNNTTLTVGKADQAYLASLFPHRSILQITANILIQRFVRTLKEHNIREYQPDKYREIIANVRITIPERGTHTPGSGVGGTESNTDSKLDVNVGLGTGTVGVAPTGSANAVRHHDVTSQDSVQRTRKNQKRQGA